MFRIFQYFSDLGLNTGQILSVFFCLRVVGEESMHLIGFHAALLGSRQGECCPFFRENSLMLPKQRENCRFFPEFQAENQRFPILGSQQGECSQFVFEELLGDNLQPAPDRKFSESTLQVSDMCKYIILCISKSPRISNKFPGQKRRLRLRRRVIWPGSSEPMQQVNHGNHKNDG